MTTRTLFSLLEAAQQYHDGERGIIAYPLGNVKSCQKLLYKDLRLTAESNARWLRSLDSFRERTVILLHFTDNLDNIVWFWSALFAGGIPAMSTPLSHNFSQKQNHQAHLRKLLKDPLCLTVTSLLGDFASHPALNIKTVDDPICQSQKIQAEATPLPVLQSETPALLMLTSGSTGNAKAVTLSHRQLFASISGKAVVRKLEDSSSFLNWIGLDHVASIVEIHLQALYLCMDQVQVQAADIITEPTIFLTLVERHRVSRSFAPNFFLARLRQDLEAQNSPKRTRTWNLASLCFLGSGGEANPVETCNAVSSLLRRFGARADVIVPGFGMTETCAGAIFNTDCPGYELDRGLEFASLGTCVPGMRMRVALSKQQGQYAASNEVGNLEVTGPVVFREYFNDDVATGQAFTNNGWFRTGDQAFMDSNGRLNLVGREKELMNINGVKHVPHELEGTLEESLHTFARSSYIVAFSYRQLHSQTEDICIIYLPIYSPEDVESRIQANDSAIKTVMLQTGVRPRVIPVDATLLQKTTLGKLSRTKIRKAFESGEYQSHEDHNKKLIKAFRASRIKAPENEIETLLLREWSRTMNIPAEELGTDTHLFEIGITSIELIRTARNIQDQLQLSVPIPMITMMTNPTIRSLSEALYKLIRPSDYSPVIPLRMEGGKSPLWLIHPGVGEVLVFLHLSEYLTDRPVYALRARGFEPGESYFSNIDETVQTYHHAIKRRQPVGPYLVAGYSYGAMLAFEVAKSLEGRGDRVPFLGCFNLPPHIKSRMMQLDWTNCLVNLTYFLDLTTEQQAHQLAPLLRMMAKPQAIAHVLAMASSTRVSELSLTPEGLENWTELAYGLQSMALNYEPTGSVSAMDVFYCTPLAIVAATKTEWREGHLSQWRDFCRTEPRYHEVDGEHYTMIGREHVLGFQKVFQKALKARDL